MSLLWVKAARKTYYYHASPHEFEPGDRVDPGGTDEWGEWRQTFPVVPGRPRDKVYLSRGRLTGEDWANRLADYLEQPVHLYKVEAPATTRHWVKDVNDYEHRASHAQVVERVSTHHPGEWDA